jgi:hypothetical protein
VSSCDEEKFRRDEGEGIEAREIMNLGQKVDEESRDYSLLREDWSP